MKTRQALLALCVLPSALPAQYGDLSTSGDGRVLFFSTSLRRTGTAESFQGRIYAIDAAGLGLVAERTREVLPPSSQGVVFTNYYSLDSPEVSSDGKMTAVQARRDCLSGRACVGAQTAETRILGAPASPEIVTRGRVRFSPGGRYAVRYPEGGVGGDRGGLLDLETGREIFVGPSLSELAWPGRPIADDGSIVTTTNSTVHVIRGNTATQLTSLFVESATQAAIDAAGRTVVYSSRWNYPHSAFSRLRAVDVATGALRTIVEGFGDFGQPVLSDDAARVLFVTTCRFDDSGLLGPPQAYVIGTDGRDLRRLTTDPSGVQFAILSGNGRVAFALTKSGRVLRIDVDSGVETELIPRTMNIGPTGHVECGAAGPLVAGSLHMISGVGYARPDGSPEPFRIRLDGSDVPVVSAGNGDVWFQTPWELSQRRVRFEITAEIPPGPFEQPVFDDQVVVSSTNACSLPLPAEYGTVGAYGMRFSHAANQDFTSLVTPEHPARPGDIVNAYPINLGPVSPPVPSGQPAPTDGSLSHLLQPLRCEAFTRDGQVDVPISFAGLAPGTVGLYQLQLRIPSGLSNLYVPGALQISCGNLILLFPVTVTLAAAQDAI